MPDVDAVTFDFWNTLVEAPDPREARATRARRIVDLFERRGVAIEEDRVGSALDEVVRVFNEEWAANRQFTGAHGSARLIELLELPDDEGLHDAVRAAFEGLGASRVPELNPNVGPTLERLRAQGVRIGIICDVGLAPSPVLRGHLEAHGVLHLFDHWSFSDEVGHYKPAREIFEHALAGLGGVSPERAVHVGDLRRTDVAGALGMGMTAVRYRGRHDDPGGPEATEAHHVIDDHVELLAILGLVEV